MGSKLLSSICLKMSSSPSGAVNDVGASRLGGHLGSYSTLGGNVAARLREGWFSCSANQGLVPLSSFSFCAPRNFFTLECH